MEVGGDNKTTISLLNKITVSIMFYVIRVFNFEHYDFII